MIEQPGTKIFKSKEGLFSLRLSSEWEYKHEGNIYTFTKKLFEGVLQVSAYYKKASIFDVEKELAKEIEDYPNAKIKHISNYNAVHYAVITPNDNVLQYFWVTGHNSIKIYCSLYLSSLLTEESIDNNYLDIVNILNTLEIQH